MDTSDSQGSDFKTALFGCWLVSNTARVGLHSLQSSEWPWTFDPPALCLGLVLLGTGAQQGSILPTEHPQSLILAFDFKSAAKN